MKRLLATISVILMLCNVSLADDEPWKYAISFPSSNIQYLNVENLHIEYKEFDEKESYNMMLQNEILKPSKIENVCVPGRIPTFLFVGVISAVGTYTLYGAGAGAVTAGLVYVCTDGNRHHTKMAIWGCVAGMAVGGFAKWLSVR